MNINRDFENNYKVSLTRLSDIAKDIRRKIITYSNYAKLPHLASCLSCVDILVILYFAVARIDAKHPTDPNRDRIILSKGHGAPALYQILAKAGFYDEALLFKPDHGNGLFGEHPPKPAYLAGVEAATGSLGHGFPMGCGFALSAKIRNMNYHTYCILGDGECNEGSIWEAAMLASAQKLDNLTLFVDYNRWQATGRSDEILNQAALQARFAAFGFETVEIDGHDLQALIKAATMRYHGKPCAIIAHTVKGKGVSFMEDDNNWHYRIPNEDELKRALLELD